MKKKVFFLLAVVAVSLSLILASCAKPAPTPTPAPSPTPAPAAKEVTLNAVSAWPLDTRDLLGFREFMKRVNDRGKGVVQIKYLGSEEVYPSDQHGPVLQKGVIDLLFTSPSYISDLFPEGVITGWNFGADAPAWRKAGMVDLVDKMGRDKVGIGTLGINWIGNFHVWLTKPIKTLDDLKNLRIRKISLYDPVYRGLGVPAVTVKFSEIFTSLQTGVIDAVTYPYNDITTYGWIDVLKYRLDPPFWRAVEVPIYYNAKNFDALSPQAKKILTDTMLELEGQISKMYDDQATAEWQIMKKKGMQTIRVTDAEWNKVQELHWTAGKAFFAQMGASQANIDKMFDTVKVFYPPKSPYAVAGN